MRLLAKITISFLLLASACQGQALFRGQNVTTGGGGAVLASQTVCGGTANCAAVESFSSPATITGLNMTAGWLVICNVVGYGGASAVGCADSKSNTYTSCKAFAGNYRNGTFFTVVTTGGTGITVTVTDTGGSFVAANVTAYSSSTGWPSNPCDQSGTQTAGNTAGTKTVTATAPNTAAVQVEFNSISSSASQGGCSTGFPGTYTQSVEGSGVNNVWVFYHISSVGETATFSYSTSTCAANDQVLTTYKPN